ncbi:hypothetical protein [Lacticaseibacillus mingshuiensis]|uniref:Uncharacterized protein n=1 Tax=Lacticaseibacillus mingshuiensis TaxID=2799574 RepID=A0ABW4CEJ9_9LACO|nr:hypothetical protein [Lacticaseibacillus mingshuiensis]
MAHDTAVTVAHHTGTWPKQKVAGPGLFLSRQLTIVGSEPNDERPMNALQAHQQTDENKNEKVDTARCVAIIEISVKKFTKNCLQNHKGCVSCVL